MNSVDGGKATTPADKPGEKQKALCVATRCTSVEQFVATFHRFCDETSFFVATLATRPVGLETAFSIQLEDKTPVLRGLCVVVEAWSTPANRFGRPGVRLDVRRLTNDSVTVFKQLQQARAAAEAASPASAPQKAMHDPAAAQAALDNAANAALDLIASEAAAAAKESKAALEAAASKAVLEAKADEAKADEAKADAAKADAAKADAAKASMNPPPLLPKGTRTGMAPLTTKSTQMIGTLTKAPATPATGTPTTKPVVTNAFPASATNPVVSAKPTKQMPPLPVNKFATPSQPFPKVRDGATPPAGSPTAPPSLPGSMRITPPTAVPVVRAVPDIAKIESTKVRAEGTAPVARGATDTSVDSEAFDEKTVDVQNKLSVVAKPVERKTSESKPVAAKPTSESKPPSSKPLDAKPLDVRLAEAQPTPKVVKPAAPKVINPGAPKAPEESRTPGSAFVLPANPLMNLTDASLEGFIDCALYEETGNFYRAEDAGLVDVGDLAQPPLPNSLAPIQVLRPGDVSDRQPSYVGPMPQQLSYMGPLPTGHIQPPPMNGYTTQPPPYRGSSTQPMPLGPDVNVTFNGQPMNATNGQPPNGQSTNGVSPTAFIARRAQSEMFSPEATPIPMLLGQSFAQQMEEAIAAASRDNAATMPPPFGQPETRTNWARPETPDPFGRNTPPPYARAEAYGRPESVTQQVEMDPQGRPTGQSLPQSRDFSTGQLTPIPGDVTGPMVPLTRDYNTGAFSPQRGGRYATGQFPPQPMTTAAPEVAPGTHPLVGPNAQPIDPNAPYPPSSPPPSYPPASDYPQYAQPPYPQQPYAQQPYPQQQPYGQPYAQAPMHAAPLPATPVTPRPRRERTQITKAVNPNRWMVIAGSAALATAAIITIVLLATRGENKTATASTQPTTKLATTRTKIDANVAKPAPEAPPTNDSAGASTPKTPAPKVEQNAISTTKDATVSHVETPAKIAAPKQEPKQEPTEPDATPGDSDGPVVVGSGPCRMEIATTPAGSTVKVDDHAIGPSPVTVAGPCKRTKIDVSHARYAPTTKWVAPAEGTPANVDIQLQRPTHAVTIVSSPAGATVSIGGRRAGTTPTSVNLMGFTTQTLTFEKKGYGSVTQKFYSKKDNDRVTVTLKKGK